MTREHLSKRLISWASVLDDRAREQAIATSTLPFVYPHVALMPDAHLDVIWTCCREVRGASGTRRCGRVRPSRDSASLRPDGSSREIKGGSAATDGRRVTRWHGCAADRFCS